MPPSAARADDATADGQLGSSGFALHAAPAGTAVLPPSTTARPARAGERAGSARKVHAAGACLWQTLGEGGFGVVFHGTRLSDGRPCALKRIRKDAHASSALRELRVARVLGAGGARGACASLLCAPLGSFGTARHVWIAYERGGLSLSQLCFSWRGVTVGGARTYELTQQPLWAWLCAGGPAAVCSLFAQLLEGLAQLHGLGVSHNDLKPDNVLLRFEPGSPRGFSELRLIDYGSATLSAAAVGGLPADGAGGDPVGGEPGCGINELHSAPSPEFAPPELLALSAGILPGASGSRARCPPAVAPSGGASRARGPPTAVETHAAAAEAARACAHGEAAFGAGDVWSAGALLLELCAGMPLWFSYPMRAVRPRDRKVVSSAGLFGRCGRQPLRLLGAQLALVGSSADTRQRGREAQRALGRALRALPGLPCACEEGSAPLVLLAAALCFQPADRPSAERLLGCVRACLREHHDEREAATERAGSPGGAAAPGTGAGGAGGERAGGGARAHAPDPHEGAREAAGPARQQREAGAAAGACDAARRAGAAVAPSAAAAAEGAAAARAGASRAPLGPCPAANRGRRP